MFLYFSFFLASLSLLFPFPCFLPAYRLSGCTGSFSISHFPTLFFLISLSLLSCISLSYFFSILRAVAATLGGRVPGNRRKGSATREVRKGEEKKQIRQIASALGKTMPFRIRNDAVCRFACLNVLIRGPKKMKIIVGVCSFPFFFVFICICF